MVVGVFVFFSYNVPEISTKKNKTTVREYVGQILSIHPCHPTTCKVKYLRSYQGKKEVFSFPNKDDIDVVSKESIIKILPKPFESRGRFDFLIDVFQKNVA